VRFLLKYLFDCRYRARRVLFCAVVVLIHAAAPVWAESDIFPVPGIIKHNVAFWIRIYTEVSLKEGLLHDRDYPQIVYEKSQTGDRTGKERDEFIRSRIKIYADAIAAVRDSAPPKWGATEKLVAEMFKNAPADAINDAENRIRHQTGQRERFKQGLERSSMYLDTISVILKRHNVPDELKYLPHVESSFDAEAYSKVGAAGLWQFMRGTGRLYMRVNYMFDERRDPFVSTEAAAKFLRANHDMLKTWPLAITAYNHGPHGMRRAAETLGTYDIAVILEKHESASFKFASKNFYACFLAVLQIMEKPEKYIKNINYKPRWQATSVKLPFAIGAAALCRSLKITETEFKRLNPSLRPIVFEQKKTLPAGYSVNIPVTISGADALAALDRSTPPPQRIAAAQESELDFDGYYTVASGDNLFSISKRLGISMTELAEVNNITNSSRIYVGQVLVAPSSSRPPSAPAVAKVKDTTVLAAKITGTAPPVAAPKDTTVLAANIVGSATPTPPLIPGSTKSTQTAQAPVQTPEQPKIFQSLRIYVTPNYDYQVSQAAEAAPFTPSPPTRRLTPLTSPPAALVLPSAEPETVTVKDTTVLAAKITGTAPPAVTAKDIAEPLASVAFAEAVAEPVSNPAQKPPIETHFDAGVYDLKITPAADGQSIRVRVSVDETIGRFAEWIRGNTDDIRVLNGMEPASTLPLGRSIDIPVGSNPNSVKRFEVNRLQYHMAIEEDFFARYNVVDFDTRKVKSGDNPWRICSDAQIPMWLLKKFNRAVNVYSLKPGDNLWIPKIAAKDAVNEGAVDFTPSVIESDGY
jgi:membrane-bound lytic murein transglycosylase D